MSRAGDGAAHVDGLPGDGRCHGCFSQSPVARAATPLTLCAGCQGAESVAFALPVGAVLAGGRYRLGRPLGVPGGFGITYFGWDGQLDRRLAIKEFFPRGAVRRDSQGSPRCVTDGDAVGAWRAQLAGFLEEARRAARVVHDHVVQVLDFVEANDTAYIVMPFLEGETLGRHREAHAGARLPWRRAVQLMLPILEALDTIHRAGIIHRDVKPANIYLVREGDGRHRPILLDFGAARAVTPSRELTGILSQGYAPLEQYDPSGKGQGAWTDVYAVAATLHELLTGHPPPSAPARQLGQVLADPRTAQPDLPADVERALEQALALAPAHRTATAGALAVALRRALAGTDASPSPSRQVHAPLTARVRGRPAVDAGATYRRAAAPLALALGGAVMTVLAAYRALVSSVPLVAPPRDAGAGATPPAATTTRPTPGDWPSAAGRADGVGPTGGTPGTPTGRPARPSNGDAPNDRAGSRPRRPRDEAAGARALAERLRDAGQYLAAWEAAKGIDDAELHRAILSACRADSAITSRRGGMMACPAPTVPDSAGRTSNP